MNYVHGWANRSMAHAASQGPKFLDSRSKLLSWLVGSPSAMKNRRNLDRTTPSVHGKELGLSAQPGLLATWTSDATPSAPPPPRCEGNIPLRG